MNRLILMRHAQAEGPGPGMDDHDRPLAARGRGDALAVARALARRGMRPDRALVSSALRTRETWEEASHAFGDVDVEVQASLYNAEAVTLRRAVEAEIERAGCLLVIAHNPGVHLLALELAIESAAPGSAMDRLHRGFPTAAAAVFQIDAAERYAFEGVIAPADLDDRP